MPGYTLVRSVVRMTSSPPVCFVSTTGSDSSIDIRLPLLGLGAGADLQLGQGRHHGAVLVAREYPSDLALGPVGHLGHRLEVALPFRRHRDAGDAAIDRVAPPFDETGGLKPVEVTHEGRALNGQRGGELALTGHPLTGQRA